MKTYRNRNFRLSIWKKRDQHFRYVQKPNDKKRRTLNTLNLSYCSQSICPLLSIKSVFVIFDSVSISLKKSIELLVNMKKNQETSWIYQFHLSLFQIIALHCIAFVLWPELLNNFRCPDVFRQRKNKHQFNVKLILEARENTFFHIDLRQFSPLLRFPIKTHKRMQIRPQNIYDSICICGRLVFCIRLGVCYFLFSLEISILFEYFVQRKMATFLMNDKEKKLGAWLMPIF